MNTFKFKDHLKGDSQIWFIAFLLSCLGTMAVYSSVSALAYRSAMSPEIYMLRHLGLVFVGFFITYLIHRIDFWALVPFAKVLLWLSPFIILYTLMFGHSEGGASRWISVMGWTVQTSDFIRVILIFNLAVMLAKNQNAMNEFKTFWPIIIWTGILCMLLALTSFSTSLILGVTCFMIMIIGRIPRRYIFRMVVSVFLGLCLAFIVGLFSKAILHKSYGRTETVINRTEAFIDKDLDGDKLIGGELGSVSLQQEQAIAAISRGGLVGVRPGRSVMKNRLAEAYSDFIYSIIIEEYGLLGGISVMLFYLWLLYRGLKIIDQSKQAFGGLLSIGLTLSIVFQAFTHMLVNVGLGPVTGQTLPLISKGGSSMLFTFMALGIVLSVSKSEEALPAVTKSR